MCAEEKCEELIVCEMQKILKSTEEISAGINLCGMSRLL